MRINEFFYWLQGYFEISGMADALTSEQCTLILRHLDLVDVGKGGSPDAARLGKMRTLLDLAVEGTLPRGIATEKIRSEVSEQFIHVIDPAAGGPEVQAKLNTIHGPGTGYGPGKRC